MTNNKDLYAALLHQGAPELPAGYFYKFTIKPKEKDHYGREAEQSRGLLCYIHKKTFGGLFSYKIKESGRVFCRPMMYRGYVDTEELLRREWITEEEVKSRQFTLGHLAYLAEESYEHFEKALAKDKQTDHISAYLNKRLP